VVLNKYFVYVLLSSSIVFAMQEKKKNAISESEAKEIIGKFENALNSFQPPLVVNELIREYSKNKKIINFYPDSNTLPIDAHILGQATAVAEEAQEVLKIYAKISTKAEIKGVPQINLQTLKQYRENYATAIANFWMLQRAFEKK
jgi:hypothetical protein